MIKEYIYFNKQSEDIPTFKACPDSVGQGILGEIICVAYDVGDKKYTILFIRADKNTRLLCDSGSVEEIEKGGFIKVFASRVMIDQLVEYGIINPEQKTWEKNTHIGLKYKGKLDKPYHMWSVALRLEV